MQLAGVVWLQREHRRLLGCDRLLLLERIADRGSISAAAKSLGMSYRTAWNAVADLNNLADEPLTRNSPGGSLGGSTRLTEYGRKLVAAVRAMECEHARLLEGLNSRWGDWDGLQQLMQRLSIRMSARNQLQGKVLAVSNGSVNAEVTLGLGGDDQLVAVVTRASIEALGLAPGRDAYAVIKSSFIILAGADEALRTTARNRLCGTVRQLFRGPVNAEVVAELDGGKTLVATVTDDSIECLGLTEGVRVCGLFKASHVILGVH